MRIPGSICVVGLFLLVTSSHAEDESTQDHIEAVKVSPKDHALLASYTKGIVPLLRRHCSQCHGEKKQKAELRFDELNPAMPSDHDSRFTQLLDDPFHRWALRYVPVPNAPTSVFQNHEHIVSPEANRSHYAEIHYPRHVHVVFGLHHLTKPLPPTPARNENQPQQPK